MAAVNMQTMNFPLDFPHHHTRSASVSSSSTHSSLSRPTSSHGGILDGMGPDDVYRAASYGLQHHGAMQADHSPPTQAKAHLRPSHIRARAAASPYPRDTDSVHSSSSETEEMAMYINPQSHEYPAYGNGVINPSAHEPSHTAGAFGRMSLSSEQHLEKLAANVRAATTTSASDRAKQIFVQAWLTANYAPYPDGNVPRQGLYFSYRRVCDQYGIPHINTATLGKAIRLCFPSIKTRRLGVRGNSKYHYCGIRPGTTAEAEFLQEYIHKSNNNAAQGSINAARAANAQAEALGRVEDRSDEDDEGDSDGISPSHHEPSHKRNSLTLGDVKNVPVFSEDFSDKTPTAAVLLSQVQAGQRPPSGSFNHTSIRRSVPAEPALSLPSHSSSPIPSYPAQAVTSVSQLPHFPTIDEAIDASSTSQQSMAAREVWTWFTEHLDALLEAIKLYRFDQFEMHIRTFWNNLVGTHREVVHAPAIAGLMARADAIVYDDILEILRSQMLSPIPPASLAGLRQLAKKMENILIVALDGYGKTFLEPKVELGARFGHLVLRFLDIYQVTQALNTVLTNQKQLHDMRRSWSKIDFESVRNQAALVCNCRHEDLVQLLEVEFVSLLDNLTKTTEPVREVMSWADKCCETLMSETRLNPNGVPDRATMRSRTVLIHWGYVTSQIMRDLTIRSDPAFGAFQILKLFLDDWIAVIVLRNVALSTHSVAASVEPVMQQQFLSLSPMPGQENFGSMDMRSHTTLMAHTPTTSSMLAALQQDAFSVDPASTAFNNGSYSTLSYMDTATPEDSSLAYPDYVSNSSFDFNAPELAIPPGPPSQPVSTNPSAAPSPLEQQSELTPADNSSTVAV